MLLLLFLLLSVGLAWAGFTSGGSFHEYDSAARDIIDAIARFHDLTGAFPVAVADLTRSAAPTQGLDASGNRTALRPLASWRPLLDSLPADPLSPSAPQWIVDLAAPGFLSSQAFRLHVRSASTPNVPEGYDAFSPSPSLAHTDIRSPGFYLLPQHLRAASSVVLSCNSCTALTPLWLDPGSGLAESLDYNGGGNPLGPGPDDASLVTLNRSLYSPMGGEPWSTVSIVRGNCSATDIGRDPIPGHGAGVAVLRGTKLIVAATSQPTPRPAHREEPYRPQPLPCDIFVVSPDRAPHHLAGLLDVSSLADGGDGRHVFVVHASAGGASGSTPSYLLGILDTTTGALRDLPASAGLALVEDGYRGPSVVSRDGYAWFLARGHSAGTLDLRRASVSGKVDVLLTTPWNEAASRSERMHQLTSFPLAFSPGPRGEALVLALQDIPGTVRGPALLRLGAAPPRVVATVTGLELSKYPDLHGVAWPPDGLGDAEAIVASPGKAAPILVVHRSSPQVCLFRSPVAGLSPSHATSGATSESASTAPPVVNLLSLQWPHEPVRPWGP
jgi:hypothetical protein